MNDSTRVIPPELIEVLPPRSPNETFLQLVQNPGVLRDLFRLNNQQMENVQALLTGGGTTLVVKLFAGYIGPELAGALGGLLSGYISRRLLSR